MHKLIHDAMYISKIEKCAGCGDNVDVHCFDCDRNFCMKCFRIEHDEERCLKHG